MEITLLFDRCHRSLAAVTLVKYERVSNNLAYNVKRSNIFLPEKLTSETLVTHTPGLIPLGLWVTYWLISMLIENASVWVDFDVNIGLFTGLSTDLYLQVLYGYSAGIGSKLTLKIIGYLTILIQPLLCINRHRNITYYVSMFRVAL